MTRTPMPLLTAAAAMTSLAFAAPSPAQPQPATPRAAHPATAPAGVDPATHAAHLKPAAGTQPGAAGDANADLVNQVAALRAQVAKLQEALAQGH